MKIMLIGKQRAGKDTVAHMLKNYGFEPFALSEGIYEIAHNIFGMGLKHRQLLIDIGEKLREIDPLVWTKHTLDSIDWSESTHQVITDVRMRHEYDYLVDHGFLPVYIYAPKEIRKERPGFTEEHEDHYTETSLTSDDCDVIIPNIGTEGDLETRVEKFVTKLLENN